MLRLLAMLFAFATFAVVLVVTLSTWTFGEVAEITSSHRKHRRSDITHCVASIRYEVDGRLYRSSDTAQISGHRPTSECPFEEGQTAIVLYTDEFPELGNSYTSTGNGWCFLGMLLLMPLAILGRGKRIQHGLH